MDLFGTIDWVLSANYKSSNEWDQKLGIDLIVKLTSIVVNNKAITMYY